MRIAVCLSGAERLESDAVTHFARNLPRDAEIDCFAFFYRFIFHLWKVTHWYFFYLLL